MVQIKSEAPNLNHFAECKQLGSLMNFDTKIPPAKKVVKSEPRRLHEFFVDQGDGLKDSPVGQVLCLNADSARHALLQIQIAGGGIKVRQLKV